MISQPAKNRKTPYSMEHSMVVKDWPMTKVKSCREKRAISHQRDKWFQACQAREVDVSIKLERTRLQSLAHTNMQSQVDRLGKQVVLRIRVLGGIYHRSELG